MPCSVLSAPRWSAWGTDPQGYGGYGLGFAPNTNIAYGVHEFAEYDPIAPLTWFKSWTATNGTSAGVPFVYYFIPGSTAPRSHVATASPTCSNVTGRPVLPAACSTTGRRRGPLPHPRCGHRHPRAGESSGGWPVDRRTGHSGARRRGRAPQRFGSRRPRPPPKSSGCGSPHCPGGTPQSTDARWRCRPTSP